TRPAAGPGRCDRNESFRVPLPLDEHRNPGSEGRRSRRGLRQAVDRRGHVGAGRDGGRDQLAAQGGDERGGRRGGRSGARAREGGGGPDERRSVGGAPLGRSPRERRRWGCRRWWGWTRRDGDDRAHGDDARSVAGAAALAPADERAAAAPSLAIADAG